MDLASFKKLHKKYHGISLPPEVWQTPDYDAYIEALNSVKSCSDWYLIQLVKQAGINHNKYCCVEMAYRLIEDKLSKKTNLINVDSVMTQNKAEFGIPIHDGGYSYIRIKYCPWCGKQL